MSSKDDDFKKEHPAEYETENPHIISENDFGNIILTATARQINESSDRLVLPDILTFAMLEDEQSMMHRLITKQPGGDMYEYEYLSKEDGVLAKHLLKQMKDKVISHVLVVAATIPRAGQFATLLQDLTRDDEAMSKIIPPSKIKVVTSDEKRDRNSIMKESHCAEIVCSVRSLVIGWNSPMLDCVVYADVPTSREILVQSLHRVARAATYECPTPGPLILLDRTSLTSTDNETLYTLIPDIPVGSSVGDIGKFIKKYEECGIREGFEYTAEGRSSRYSSQHFRIHFEVERLHEKKCFLVKFPGSGVVWSGFNFEATVNGRHIASDLFLFNIRRVKRRSYAIVPFIPTDLSLYHDNPYVFNCIVFFSLN